MSSTIASLLERTRVRLLVCAIGIAVSFAVLAPAVLAGQEVVLSWPETGRPVADGASVTVGEFMRLGSSPIPCQAFATGTLAVNGGPVDEVSGTTQAPWEECGATRVTGAFTQLQLAGGAILGVADPPLSITGPGSCAYGLERVSGTGALGGSRASFTVSGQAALRRPAAAGCPATLPYDGSIGLYGPQSGGVGLLIWSLAPAAAVPEALATVERYWADIGEHRFTGAYAYLAPHALGVGASAFAAAERRTGVRHVAFSGRLAGEGRTGTAEQASVQVLSLVTQDATFGCRVWSGSYRLIELHGAWHIARALLRPRRCA